MRNSYLASFIGLLFIYSFSSCISAKKIVYFKNIPDSIYQTPYVIQLSQYADPKIQVNDLLAVTIQTLDAQTVSMTTVAQGGNVSMGTAQGYLVDKNGFIDLPLVGRVEVIGLSLTEARAVIARKATQYYKDPVVNVKYSNFSVTMLGEVGRPGQFVFPSEKVSILDAFAMAGDLTFTGRRDNILLIREEEGEKKFIRLDLNTADLFKSPYFYLKQRDVIYVEPNKGKIVSSDAVFNRNLSLFSFALGTFGIALSLYTYFRR